jgi:hypothetical protein
VFDLWVRVWRRKQASGDMIVVRFADDVVLGFQERSEAERFWKELSERLRKFRLELHPDKTRLLEFGPYAAENRERRGEGKPETFDFLGFTHICGKKRSNAMFTVLRQTIRKRLQAKLSEVKAELKRPMHDPVPEMGRWLRAVVEGHNRYYGVPMNGPRSSCFGSRWFGSGIAHCRGAARTVAYSGTGCCGLLTAGCPFLASIIRIPCAASASSPQAGAGCGKSARPDLSRGLWVTMIPTQTGRETSTNDIAITMTSARGTMPGVQT